MKIIWIAMLTMLLTCCTVTQKSNSEDREKDNLTEEQKIQNQVEILVEAMTLKKPKIKIICKKLISIGEKAIPELSKDVCIHNRDVLIRSSCMYCLANIYLKNKNNSNISRKVKALAPKFLKRLRTDRVLSVRLEAASALCAIGNYEGVPLLLNTLNHKAFHYRESAVLVLRKTFKQEFGYEAYNFSTMQEYKQMSTEQKKSHIREKTALRAVAISKWRRWWQENQNTYLANNS